MKFNEKLQVLRKEQNMSQEQLAEKLDVSRQSVSKWESGNTYPEMDKLLSLCKIFNCSLEDLTNDEVTDILAISKKNKSVSSYTNEIIDIFNRTINVMNNLNKKGKFEFFKGIFILLIGLLILLIPFNVISSLFIDVFRSLDGSIFQVIKAFIELMFNLTYFVSCILIFVYVYKNYILIKAEENVNNKGDDLPSESIQELTKSNDEIISDVNELVKTNNKDSNKKTSSIKAEKIESIIFSTISKLFNIMFKALLVFTAFPIMFLFGITVFSVSLVIFALFIGIDIFGFLIVGIASLIGIAFTLYVITNFILDRKKFPKYTFQIIIVTLLLFGIGFAFSAIEFTSFKYVKDPFYNIDTTEKTVTYNKDEIDFIESDYYITKESYIIDDSLDNIVITYKYNPNSIMVDSYISEKELTFDITNIDNNKFSSAFALLINDLKNNQIRHDYGTDYIYIEIRGNKDEIARLKENSNNYYNNDDYSSCEEISSEYNQKIEELEQENEELRVKTSNLENTIEEFKNQISILE